MTSKLRKSSVAIVGFGPRGLGALEALALEAKKNNVVVTVDIFDPFAWPGAGPNFDPDQSDLCILNIPIRSLDIDPPNFLSDHIGPFPEWSSKEYHKDDFPPRSDLGAYLNARFIKLVNQTNGVLIVNEIDEKVIGIKQSTTGWSIRGNHNTFGPYDEVVLSPGQPMTAPDPQLKNWVEHAELHGLDLKDAYPASTLLKAAKGWTDATVAVRGLGLSTLDVVRMLTVGLGGVFEKGRYIASGSEPRKILPFSLDGQPPAAKPATAEIDGLYDPTSEETEAFVSAIRKAVSQPADAALVSICDALMVPTYRILHQLEGNQSLEDIGVWLGIERAEPGGQVTQSPIETLKTTIDFAHKRMPPNIGYAVGQIWRKWQNELRLAFNSADLSPKTASSIVSFDEGLKRFSYGPPVSAAEELLCLIKHGIVSLCVVDDPAVILESKGWRLMEADDTLCASVMVNAVLPSPKLANVTDAFISQCVANGTMQEISAGLGAATRPDGTLVTSSAKSAPVVSLLGRLSLGSVIAADSLHDCFGASSNRWAEGFAKRNFHAAP